MVSVNFSLIVLCSIAMCSAKPYSDFSPKRIALNELIGNLENDLFKTALAANNIAQTQGVREKRSSTSAPVVKQTIQEDSSKLIIDRVVVLKGPAESLLPHIPVFSKLKSAVEDEVVTTTEGSGDVDIDATTLEPTTIFDEVETTFSSSSTKVPSTTSIPISSSTASTTTTSTTTKAPIVQLKEAEDDIQEKVAEVAADPIIFSSRV